MGVLWAGCAPGRQAWQATHLWPQSCWVPACQQLSLESDSGRAAWPRVACGSRALSPPLRTRAPCCPSPGCRRRPGPPARSSHPDAPGAVGAAAFHVATYVSARAQCGPMLAGHPDRMESRGRTPPLSVGGPGIHWLWLQDRLQPDVGRGAPQRQSRCGPGRSRWAGRREQGWGAWQGLSQTRARPRPVTGHVGGGAGSPGPLASVWRLHTGIFSTAWQSASNPGPASCRPLRADPQATPHLASPDKRTLRGTLEGRGEPRSGSLPITCLPPPTPEAWAPLPSTASQEPVRRPAAPLHAAW